MQLTVGASQALPATGAPRAPSRGAFLGGAQAHVLRRALPDLPAWRWVAVTSAAAMAAWLIGLLPSTFGEALVAWPVVIRAAALVVGGTALLPSIGTVTGLGLQRLLPARDRRILR